MTSSPGARLPHFTTLTEGVRITIAVGKRADLVLLDADPLRDIRNTRQISGVVLRGRPFAKAGLAQITARHLRHQ